MYVTQPSLKHEPFQMTNMEGGILFTFPPDHRKLTNMVGGILFTFFAGHQVIIAHLRNNLMLIIISLDQ